MSFLQYNFKTISLVFKSAIMKLLIATIFVCAISNIQSSAQSIKRDSALIKKIDTMFRDDQFWRKEYMKIDKHEKSDYDEATIEAKWFDKYTRENVTATEALIRATLVMVIPVFSAIDWDCGVHTMIYIAPIIFYSEVTVFTMTCPIKSLFSNYTTVRTNNIQKRPVKS